MHNVECTCDDWKQNIDLVNGPIQLQFVRTGVQYAGKKFTHCPWCGVELRRKPMQMLFTNELMKKAMEDDEPTGCLACGAIAGTCVDFPNCPGSLDISHSAEGTR